MITVLYIVQILLCAALVVLITTSDKEEQGLSGAFGGGSGGGGGKNRIKPGYEEQMDNVTKYVAIGFFVFSLMVAHFTR